MPSGELTALLGPSGSGKSTLLRVIAGLEQPDTGAVTIDGRDVTNVPPQKRDVGFVFQHYAAFKHMTVWDNVAFGLTIRTAQEGRDQRARRRADRARPARRAREALPGAALRRPAAADGARARARGRAAGAAPRRAVRRARRARAEGAAGVASRAARAHARDDRAGHARPGGGDGGRRLGRADEQRAGSSRSASRSDLYELPASEFVMSFVGPVNRVGDALVRPHDVEVSLDPADGAEEAMIERVVRLGFEVRVELVRERRPSPVGAARARRGGAARARARADRVRAHDPRDGVRGRRRRRSRRRSRVDRVSARSQPGDDRGRVGVGADLGREQQRVGEPEQPRLVGAVAVGRRPRVAGREVVDDEQAARPQPDGRVERLARRACRGRRRRARAGRTGRAARARCQSPASTVTRGSSAKSSRASARAVRVALDADEAESREAAPAIQASPTPQPVPVSPIRPAPSPPASTDEQPAVRRAARVLEPGAAGRLDRAGDERREPGRARWAAVPSTDTPSVAASRVPRKR